MNIKVGDTVKFIDKAFPFLYGAVGTVISVYSASRITVEYPDKYSHNGTPQWSNGVSQVEICTPDPIKMPDERDYYSHLTGEA